MKIAAIVLAFILASCSSVNNATDYVITVLAKINATVQAQLVGVEGVAMAATPPDQDGFNCAAATIVVGNQINAVVTAAGKAPGLLTTAELATLFQPGSAQYNQAANTIGTGCIAKANDVLGPTGVVAAGGVFGAMAAGKVLPVLAAAP